MFAEPILHVDMDAFFVEVERLRSPKLKGIPVVVGGAGPRSVVAAASYEAREFGIHSAMPMVEARRRCPGIVIVPPDHDEYSRASGIVFEVLRGFTPLVEPVSIDEAFLDVSGLRLHYASAAAVAMGIRSAIRERVDLPASVGIATTKFVAKLASEEAKPDGLFVVTLEGCQVFLDALPVTKMWGVGAATAAALARIGVATVADLRSCGERVLGRELGPSLAGHLLALATGIDPRPVVPESDAKSVSVEETFETDLTTGSEIASVLRGQADKVGRRLRRARLRGRTITVKIRYTDFRTITRSETLGNDTDVGAVIGEVASRLAASAWTESAPVRLLGVGASNLVGADEPIQLTVAGDDRRRSLDAALDDLADRFGGDIVDRASKIVNDPRSRGH